MEQQRERATTHECEVIYHNINTQNKTWNLEREKNVLFLLLIRDFKCTFQKVTIKKEKKKKKKMKYECEKNQYMPALLMVFIIVIVITFFQQKFTLECFGDFILTKYRGKKKNENSLFQFVFYFLRCSALPSSFSCTVLTMLFRWCLVMYRIIFIT